MTSQKYSVQQYSIEDIIGFIKSGTIAVPEIQRPFVWEKSQVRDLIDSLYNGYPTGFLVTWQNPAVKLKDGSMSGNKRTMIDGQQRVTAIMAAILGMKVVDDDYNEIRIKIAFNPFPEQGGERFEVQDQSHLKSKKWIPDLSVLFATDYSSFKFVPEYCSNNPGVDPQQLNDEIEKLRDIRHIPMGIIELTGDLDIETVTEIFVRINSKGTVLDQADFVMSKIAANSEYGGQHLHDKIDFFCHIISKPEFYNILSKKDGFENSDLEKKLSWVSQIHDPLYKPSYDDVLRVSFMYKFRRGKLSNLVSLLSGRNFETRMYEEAIAEQTFHDMDVAVNEFIRQYSFKDFLTCISGVGFKYEAMIRSAMSIDFAYTLYLILSESGMQKNKIGPYVGRWFVMSVLTGRYTSSPESKMDRDLRAIREKGFETLLAEIEASELSDNYWDVTLKQRLESVSTSSPVYLTYLASQIYNEDNALFMSNVKVSELVNLSLGDIHHIFPKDYLRKNGFEQNKYNQIANYAYISKKSNILISKDSPKDYFGKVFEQCKTKNIVIGDIVDEDVLKENMGINCIPESIVNMDFNSYDEFLDARRTLMAAKIKEYYGKLKEKC